MAFKPGSFVSFDYGGELLTGRILREVNGRYRVDVDGERFSVDPQQNGMRPVDDPEDEPRRDLMMPKYGVA